MKQHISLLLSFLALIVALSACGQSEEAPTVPSPSLEITTAVSESPSPSPTPTPTPSPSPTPAPTPTPTPLTPMEQAIKEMNTIYSKDSRIKSTDFHEWQGKLKVEMQFLSSVNVSEFPEIVQEVTDNILSVCEENNILCLDDTIILLTEIKSGLGFETVKWTSSMQLQDVGNENLLTGNIYDERDAFDVYYDVSAYEVSSVLLSDAEIQAKQEAEAAIPIGHKNALNAAGSYLNVMAFSYSGLIDQLEYEGYTTEEATYAADNCGADWYEQAAKMAKEYLDTMSFSRTGLISQLEYEGFTNEQAVYGVEANGY